jgi:hypothetical protein
MLGRNNKQMSVPKKNLYDQGIVRPTEDMVERSAYMNTSTKYGQVLAFTF